MTGVITSIPPLVEQPPGNNSSNPAGLPGVTYTAAIPTLPQTWTGVQTFLPNTIVFSGSGGASQVIKQTTLGGPLTVGQLAFSDISGTISATQIPAPTPTTLGGVFSKVAVAHNFLTQIGTDGSVSQSQPAFSDISGTIAATQLPNPSATTLGGIQSAAAVSHQWINSISISGVPALSQPAFSDISGSVAATQLPNPSATTLGGVQSLAAVASKWINTISTSGVPSATQPAFADISGSVAAAQMPALTGDITTTAGTVATSIGANKVTNAMRAQMAAYTLKGNATGATANEADIDITTLTLKAAPVSADIVLIQDSAAANAYKKATVGSLASAGSVASYNTRTGAVTATGTDVPLRSYLAGLTLSTAGGSASFGIAAGVATDSTNVSMMSLASSLTKSTSAWAVGAGGGLDTGVIANQWYHVYLIQRPDTGVVDVCFSASATAPTFGTNIPAAYTLFRRIGSIFKASSVWSGFTQIEETFYWTTVVQDANTAVQGTTAILYPLSVPTGVMVRPLFRFITPGANTGVMLITSPSESNVAVGTSWSTTPGFDQAGSTAQVFEGGVLYTDTSANIRVITNVASQGLAIYTRGWIDSRGRFN